jgi:hypothetical protein
MTGRRWLRLFATTIAVIVAVVIGLAGLLYFFGGMWSPTPEMRTAYARLAAAHQAPAVQERFTIPIPGCVCHSDDPVQVMSHASYRIRDCNRCHERVGPPPG